MIPAALLSIIFSVAGIVVPEADAIVSRQLDARKCYVLAFNHDKSAAWMSPAMDCRKPPAQRSATR
jgi:hypothetical protein